MLVLTCSSRHVGWSNAGTTEEEKKERKTGRLHEAIEGAERVLHSGVGQKVRDSELL